MGAFDEMGNLENCACTEEDGLAMALVLDLLHLLTVYELKPESHFLHMIFNIKDQQVSQWKESPPLTSINLNVATRLAGRVGNLEDPQFISEKYKNENTIRREKRAGKKLCCPFLFCFLSSLQLYRDFISKGVGVYHQGALWNETKPKRLGLTRLKMLRVSSLLK